MTLLVTGLVIFIGVHTLPMFITIRQGLITKYGELPYKGMFALISCIGFTLIVLGKYQAEVIPVWQPPAWGLQLPFYIMPFAFILLCAAYLPSSVRRITRHPMLWGVTLWALAHLPANGDLASIMLFGSLGLFSLADMYSANCRGAVRVRQSYAWYQDCLVIIIGLTIFWLTLQWHPEAPFTASGN
jgi:uncharacterized membrane protein